MATESQNEPSLEIERLQRVITDLQANKSAKESRILGVMEKTMNLIAQHKTHLKHILDQQRREVTDILSIDDIYHTDRQRVETYHAALKQTWTALNSIDLAVDNQLTVPCSSLQQEIRSLSTELKNEEYHEREPAKAVPGQHQDAGT